MLEQIISIHVVEALLVLLVCFGAYNLIRQYRSANLSISENKESNNQIAQEGFDAIVDLKQVENSGKTLSKEGENKKEQAPENKTVLKDYIGDFF